MRGRRDRLFGAQGTHDEIITDKILDVGSDVLSNRAELIFCNCPDPFSPPRRCDDPHGSVAHQRHLLLECQADMDNVESMTRIPSQHHSHMKGWLPWLLLCLFRSEHRNAGRTEQLLDVRSELFPRKVFPLDIEAEWFHNYVHPTLPPERVTSLWVVTDGKPRAVWHYKKR